MRDTLQPTLDLLDDGLRLYRREFPRFALIIALGALPMIALTLLIIRRPDLLASGGGLVTILLVALISMPLSVYLMGAISRAAATALRGESVTLREALAIRPLRLVGMGCYGGVFLTITNLAVSIMSMVCFCPLYAVMGAAAGSMAGLASGSGQASAALVGLLGVIIVVAFVLLYGFSLVLSGATYGSLIFSLQPFVQGKLRMGAALRRSIDMTFYRFGANLLAYMCASLIFGALAIGSTLAIGVLVPLPLIFLLGSESPIAQGFSAAALLVGLTLALPPLPIWMAVLYVRRSAERDGDDLAARIAAFAGSDSIGYPDQDDI
ncbi:MAG: hypothetical protein WCI67_05770 [Chloroflexales bacterium]